jgi:hypothetical protein
MTEQALVGVCHYFVDEAGDSALFDRKGRDIVGQPGCSRWFALGVLHVIDPPSLESQMGALRTALLADPYFRRVPSMQPAARKTAVFFHAKDDLPEVRREVFKLLTTQQLRFYAVVRDKRCILADVRQRNDRNPGDRYHPNELYDALTRRLFKQRLHKQQQYQVCFATRGKSDRTAALRLALQAARRRFQRDSGIRTDAPVEVEARPAWRSAGLQAADYFLWSLQRLFERREPRYLEYLWPAFGLVHDVDDRRGNAYGVYYTQRNPLRVENLKKEPGI